MEELKVLELFSGIGGMHFALKQSSVPMKVVAAVDINDNATRTYRHNFPESNCLNRNIQKLRMKDFDAVNCILMSPPCQPFTRNGKFKDVDDRRTDAFTVICEIIKFGELPLLKFVLLENVVGFEKSEMHKFFLESLKSAGFYYQEFIISPTQIGVANTRHRYYCIARKLNTFPFASPEILTSLPNFKSFPEPPPIASYIDKVDLQNENRLLLPDVLKKRFQILDIRTAESINSMCFTKSYGRYLEGTGSVYCPMNRDDMVERISLIEQTEENLEMKKSLRLRFFSPQEISRLMSFPLSFNFPETISERQRYQLLGNSINVAVVSELIKLMYTR